MPTDEKPPVISLTTDFGNRDGYPGILKGVILSIAPQAQIVDITNEVPGFSIGSAAWIIRNSYKFFADRTVHLVIVDPQVGSSQRPILVHSRQASFVGPDNGFISFVLP